MKYNLLLDDFRTVEQIKARVNLPNNFCVLVTNYHDFVAHIEKHGLVNIAAISWDHDLGDAAMAEALRNNFQAFDYNNLNGEKTGYDCVKWLINYCIENKLPITFENFYHTANSVGAANMKSYINSYTKSNA